MSAEAIAAQLSGPTSQQFETAVESAAIQIATVLCSLLEDSGESPDGARTPLPSALLTASDTSAAFNYVWTPAIGECWALLNGETDSTHREHAVARLFANALAYGFPEPERIKLGRPCHILWRNLLLPDVSTISFDGGRAEQPLAVTRGSTRSSTEAVI